MLLGAFIKHMTSLRLFFPHPTAPYLGIGLRSLVDNLRKVACPIWYDGNSYHSRAQHDCDLRPPIQMATDSVNDQITGLKLCDHIPSVPDAADGTNSKN
jgi:hypothetical protein